MTDAMQTIREALTKLRSFAKSLDCDYQEECTPGDDGMCQSCKHVFIADKALTALDSLARAPSEDAEAFCKRHQYLMSPAIIQARDERIRRETLGECPYRKAKRFYCKDGNSTVAICTKSEATNEQ